MAPDSGCRRCGGAGRQSAYGVQFKPSPAEGKGELAPNRRATECWGTRLPKCCDGHGLMGLRSAEKFVPDAIFGLSDEQIARFLGVMYACDGHVYCSDRLAQIGYTTISERLARDVQHLLLRLGIVATIRTLKRPVYEGTGKVAREVRITSQESLRRFCELIQRPGQGGETGRGLGAARCRTAFDQHGHLATGDLGGHPARQGRAILGRCQRADRSATKPQLACRRARALRAGSWPS